jgi:hypothetical protein
MTTFSPSGLPFLREGLRRLIEGTPPDEGRFDLHEYLGRSSYAVRDVEA